MSLGLMSHEIGLKDMPSFEYIDIKIVSEQYKPYTFGG